MTPGPVAGPGGAGAAADSAAQGRPAASSSPGDSPGGFGIHVDPDLLTGDSADLARAVRSRTGIARLDRLVEARIRSLAVLGPEQAGLAIVSTMLRRAPTAMFLLLPVFALIVQLLYVRARRFYVEHFVFSLHYHAFGFTLNTLAVLFDGTRVPALLFGWLVLYLPIALHRVYRNGWLVTMLKSFVLGVVYMFVLGIALVGTLIIAVLMA